LLVVLVNPLHQALGVFSGPNFFQFFFLNGKKLEIKGISFLHVVQARGPNQSHKVKRRKKYEVIKKEDHLLEALVSS